MNLGLKMKLPYRVIYQSEMNSKNKFMCEDVLILPEWGIYCLVDTHLYDKKSFSVLDLFREHLFNFYNSFSVDIDKTMPIGIDSNLSLEENAIRNALESFSIHLKTLNFDKQIVDQVFVSINLLFLHKNYMAFFHSDKESLKIKTEIDFSHRLVGQLEKRKDRNFEENYNYEKLFVGLDDRPLNHIRIPYQSGQVAFLSSDGIFKYTEENDFNQLMDFPRKLEESHLNRIAQIASSNGSKENQSLVAIVF